ncbi:MAG TPA: TonB family protein [Pyrinomonadaceae bacterium]|nr:TonB family protein [Pyrinomonadaceae bacterium]
MALFCLIALATYADCQSRSANVAVLDFGSSPTGARATATVRSIFIDKPSDEFSLVDSDLARAAARGAGFQGSLNLTTQEARDLGAAIGCEFYFIGDAETLRRSPSIGASYFESFASIFLVSARTGRLILWERPLEKRDTAADAESALLKSLASEETRQRYQNVVRRALEDERAERQLAIEKPASIIEVMSDDDKTTEDKDVRPPRPYRRPKPPYPESAARAEVEAVVDVLVDVDARGEISYLEIARWAGYGLDQSVLDTVKQMHFFPAMRSGVAIPMRVLLRYNFRKPPK